MVKYTFEKMLEIVRFKADVNGELRYEIYVYDDCYKVKLYDFIIMGCTTLQIPICTMTINKKTFVIDNIEHNYILVTKWNKRIVAAIGNLVSCMIEDFKYYGTNLKYIKN